MGVLSLVAAALLSAADRKVDPTFLHRFLPDLPAVNSDVTTPSCHYRPVFGADSSPIVRGVARFGELTVDAGGASNPVRYAAEEQAWVMLAGAGSASYGGESVPVRKYDFFYVPPGISHGLKCNAGETCRALIMGYRIPPGSQVTAPAKLQIANMEEVKLQTVGGHPDSVLYRLLMGGSDSQRDRIAAARVLSSLFVMEFEPGGTNFPHHHETEEEIYYVLSGSGEMVAGGGMDGVEGRHPAKPGDAYFFRLNCTVGFYAAKDSREKARILAVRSRFPFRGR